MRKVNRLRGLKLAIKPVEISRGWEKGPRAPISSWSRAVTDKNGLFSITNIDPVSSRLVMFPEHGSNFEIISLEFGDITVYSAAFRGGFPTWFGKPTIAIESGSLLRTWLLRCKSHGCEFVDACFFKTENPLTNMEIDLTVLHRTGAPNSFSLALAAAADPQGDLLKLMPRVTL